MELGVVFEEELLFRWRYIVDERGATDADYGATEGVRGAGGERERIGGRTYDVNILKYMPQFVGRGGILNCGRGDIILISLTTGTSGIYRLGGAV